MKYQLIATAFITILLSVNAIAINADNTAKKPAATQATPADNQTQQREILGWLIISNTNEIEAAKEVLKRKDLIPQVKAFAQTIVNQHTQLLQETKDLSKNIHATPINNQTTRSLASQGKQGLYDLKQLMDLDIQKPYINSMVTRQAETIAAINGYIKTETNPEVKKLLEKTQQNITASLDKAEKIQKEIEI